MPFGSRNAVERENSIDEIVKIRLINQCEIDEWKTSEQFAFRSAILRKIRSHQEQAIHVVRLHYIGHEAAVQNDALNAGADGQVHHPADGLHLHAAKLRGAAEPLFDFGKRCIVHSGRQTTAVVKRCHCIARETSTAV